MRVSPAMGVAAPEARTPPQGAPGARGAAGTPGTAGTPGLPGAPATKLFAQITSAGTVNASGSTVQASHVTTGDTVAVETFSGTTLTDSSFYLAVLC